MERCLDEIRSPRQPRCHGAPAQTERLLLGLGLPMYLSDLVWSELVELHQQRRVADDGRHHEARILVAVSLNNDPCRMHTFFATELYAG